MTTDPINPKHYNSHPSGVECITITEHMPFLLGNVVKYVWRADLKGEGLEDLEKAAWYLAREIALRESAAKPIQRREAVEAKPASKAYDGSAERQERNDRRVFVDFYTSPTPGTFLDDEPLGSRSSGDAFFEVVGVDVDDFKPTLAVGDVLSTLKDYEEAPVGTRIVAAGGTEILKTDVDTWFSNGCWKTSNVMAWSTRQRTVIEVPSS